MRREGHAIGKPRSHCCNKTEKRIVIGSPTFYGSFPRNKSRGKAKGRFKRLLSDIPSTHLVSDWRVNKPSFPSICKLARSGLKWDANTDWSINHDDAEENDSDDADNVPKAWAISISLLLDTTSRHISEIVDTRKVLLKTHMEASSVKKYQRRHAALSEVSDGDFTDAEELDFRNFNHEFEVLRSEIEAECSGTRTERNADSWSHIKLSDIDESSLGEWEDDWSVVEDEITA